jgi:hypothetical protein
LATSFTFGFSPARTGLCFVTLLLLAVNVHSQTQPETAPSRIVSGVVLTDRNEAVRSASISAVSASGTTQTVTDAQGNFRLRVPAGPVTLQVSGKYIDSQESS